jgi:RNA processing factor Prp31
MDAPRVTLETDPETDDESVIIDIAAPMEVDKAVERMREYTRQWVHLAPPNVLGLIRLIPDIA